ncbi:mitochondrial 39-S ribosomal protein L47 (MRP-L47)-domain-containing protein [Xylaria sp. CBS 124048]|nr:mitochondrial 39-S ribosomal protein L47 (MRP-L47)-domain-containing protein [Xylaria sp. CBS 124048]
MATPLSIRPSIGRIVNAAKLFPGATTNLLGLAMPTTACQKCSFSSTPEYNNRRPRRDNNRLRGLSSIHRSGTRFRMNIDKSQLPQPVKYKPKVEVDPNHGLWDFFYAKGKLLLTPEEAAEHGRGWTVEELRQKSWEDLHKLWWVCVKEQNRVATARKEKSRLKFTEGFDEDALRLVAVRKTMKSIKHTLTERWYLWEDARKLAEEDPEIDLNDKKKPYKPKEDYFEERADALETSDQPQSAQPQTPSGFMTEESSTPKLELDGVDPSTVPPKTPETQAQAKP